MPHQQASGARIKNSGRENHVNSRLLCFAGSGNQKGATLRLGWVVVIDVLQVLFEPLFNFLIPASLSFTPSKVAIPDQAFPLALVADTELSPAFCFQSDGKVIPTMGLPSLRIIASPPGVAD